jgi:hypothetical protein
MHVGVGAVAAGAEFLEFHYPGYPIPKRERKFLCVVVCCVLELVLCVGK